MIPPSDSRRHVVVIGGGITGLASAHRLAELDPALQITVLEASGRLGGVLDTTRRDGFLIERSADNFITDVPWAIELCRRIGFADQLIPTASLERRALVVRRGQLEPVPGGFALMAPRRLWPLLTSPILSPWGKARLLAEYFVPRRSADTDESLASFARRRLGREVFERLVQPLVGGIYTADPEKLSVQAALPRFVRMERRWGSLIRAARAQRQSADGESSQVDGGARYGLFVAPREGMTSLVEALARRLPQDCVRLHHAVDAIAKLAGGRWQVRMSAPPGTASTLTCDAVIVTVPAVSAARMLIGLDRSLAADLQQIHYAGSVVVAMTYRSNQIARAIDGFGFVVPAIEKRRILAGSFASVKFAGRAPEGTLLVRVFIGGACQSELADLDDQQLRTIATEELGALLGIRGEPLFCDIARWPHAMPQYHLNHCAGVAAIERQAATWGTLALAGNAYRGVGIPSCIHSGEQAAERMLAALPPTQESDTN